VSAGTRLLASRRRKKKGFSLEGGHTVAARRERFDIPLMKSTLNNQYYRNELLKSPSIMKKGEKESPDGRTDPERKHQDRGIYLCNSERERASSYNRAQATPKRSKDLKQFLPKKRRPLRLNLGGGSVPRRGKEFPLETLPGGGGATSRDHLPLQRKVFKKNFPLTGQT